MKKVLWVSDGFVPTGFSRVAHNLISRAPDEIEVHHLAINYYGDPHNFKHKMYPAFPGGDVYGFGRLPRLVKKIRPDYIFLFNDVNVIHKYLEVLHKENIKDIPVYVYFPVDSEYLDERYFSLYPLLVKKVFSYTEFAKKEINRVFDVDVELLPHGIDNHFYRLPENEISEIKEKLAGSKDLFIVLNANRNQPRKRIDITIQAFSEFSSGKDDVRLYLHMGTRDAGWDIIRLSKRYGIENKLILTSMNPGVQTVSDETLNTIYNIADLGLQTSTGEGFGLTNFEMGSLGIPQVVPNNSASGELFGDIGVVVEPIMKDIAIGTNTEFSLVHPHDVANAMERLYTDSEYYDRVAIATANKFSSDIYNWDNIANKLWSNF